MSRSGITYSLRIAPFAAIVALVSILLLSPELGQHGLSSTLEIPIANRAEAELGTPHFGMTRSPWLPDQARAWSLRYFAWPMPGAPVEWALRLPGLIACGLIVGLTAALSYLHHSKILPAITAASIAISCPALISQARTLSGNPVGEFFVTFIVFSLMLATTTSSTKRCLQIGGVLAGLSMIAATASCGIAFALAFPLLIIALSGSAGTPRQWRRWSFLGFIVTGLICSFLIYHQSDGFSPILGAAREPLTSDPAPNFLESIVQTVYAVFPWAPLLIASVLVPSKNQWPVLWLLTGIGVDALWSYLYSSSPISIVVPASIVAAHVLDRCLSNETPTSERRLLVFAILICFYVINKEVTRSPNQLYWPLERWVPIIPEIYKTPKPDPLLKSMIHGAFWGMLLAYFLAHARIPRFCIERGPNFFRDLFSLLETRINRVPNRRFLAYSAMFLVALGQLYTYGFRIIDRNSELSSALRPLKQLEQWIDQEQLGETLGVLSNEDAGLHRYLPQNVKLHTLSSRHELADWLVHPDPRAAWIELSDYPAIFKQTREQNAFVGIVNQQHEKFRLIANRLPSGARNYDRLPSIVHSDTPALEHSVSINYGDVVELLGWEFEEPVVRGSDATLHLALRVLSRCPSGLQIFARLQKGKLSRLNVQAFAPAEGLFPPQYWKTGDIILQRKSFPASYLNSLPGEHELIVAIRRGPRKNFKVKPPPQGFSDPIRVRGKKKEFVVVGKVPVQ